MIQDINGTLKELQDKDKIQNVLSQGVNVFLSSTYIDLVEERKSVHDFLENMGCHVIWMEDFAPQQRPPIKVCLSQLGECKIYVCIIKKRYGSLEDQTNKSMTQLEYERARGMNIKRCILIADSVTCAVRLRSPAAGKLCAEGNHGTNRSHRSDSVV